MQAQYKNFDATAPTPIWQRDSTLVDCVNGKIQWPNVTMTQVFHNEAGLNLNGLNLPPLVLQRVQDHHVYLTSHADSYLVSAFFATFASFAKPFRAGTASTISKISVLVQGVTRERPVAVSWCRLCIGFKLNVDSSVGESFGRSGIGGVIRDTLGRIVFGFSKNIPARINLEAEALA
ncbi:hypothetical protein ACH5RR_029376 [Cinchona calisaya]|uniref:RNase H type-1 domain-containing protein n=1 Tax=Cinchona calisaya TaxID=153742 RepID=A0ABD2YRG9_9GENT